MHRLNILLAGQGWFGAEALKVIQEEHDVSHVACPITLDKPDKLFLQADLHRIPVIKAGTLNADSVPAGIDLIVAAHSHDFIGQKTRLKTTFGAIGYHPSLLPLHRGRDAVRWTINMGDRIAGGTVFWLNETVDGGPVAAQDWCFVRPGDTPMELWRRDLAPMGLRLLRKTMLDISQGVIVKVDQDHTLATWEPSFDSAPRLYRPDLELIGYMPGGFRVEKRPEYLRGGAA